MTHWTHVLSNVSLVEFVLLAALTTLQWVRHRIRGAGWVALSFAILGGLSLALKIDPGLVTNQNVAKTLIALLLVMPYCLFRFAATFRGPSRLVQSLAIVLTAGIVLFTFTLKYLPAPGFPAPPHYLAYRISFLVAFGFLCGYVVVSLFLAGRGEPPIAASRMHLLALAVAGLEIQVVVAALGLQGATVDLVTQALTVVMGVLFLVALVLPSFVRVFLSRKEDVAFRRAVSELVSAGDSRDVAEHLLPHVCALVGAQWAALLAGDGTVVARSPVWTDDDGAAAWDADGAGSGQRRITVQTKSGATPRPRRQDQPLHAVLRQRGAASARPAGRHGRTGHRALRDGRADGLPGLARRADRAGQPHHVHGAVGGGHAPRRDAAGPRWPSSSSTSTASNWSTTGRIIRPATSSSTRWPTGSPP